VQAHMTQVGSDVVITYDGSNDVTVKNMLTADFGAGDFILV